MNASACNVCKKPAHQSCAACNTTFYCSKEHQKKDWKEHKKRCAPYTTLTNDIFGRYLVATRNIEPGEIIMRKKPLILGPKTVSYPLCLGCHKRIYEGYICSKCSWPLCGKECENSDKHVEECEVFSKSNFVPNIKFADIKQSAYSSIIPLRCLLLKKQQKTKYNTLMEFQSHLETCVDCPVYKILSRNLVPFFNNILKIETTEEELLKLCSIFDTNSFDVRDPEGTVNIRGLYPTINLMAHSCKHNTKHSYETPNFQILLIATTPIIKGEMITTTYTQTLWNTLMRRNHLKLAKNFDCSCDRCKDPTEFGTYASSFICECQKKGMVISNNPLDKNSDWKCEECGQLRSSEETRISNEELRREIKEIGRSSPWNFEQFLLKHEKKLHKKNSHVLEVKYVLSQMYGNMPGFALTDLSDSLLARKIELCKDLLEIADILEPGYSRFRGLLLFDLHAALTLQAKKEYSNGNMSKDVAQEILEEALKYLQEADKILVFEPDMKHITQEKLRNLNTNLELK